MNLSKSVRFAFNAMNAVKKNHLSDENFFSPLQAECGEENFSPLPAECGEKKFFTAKIVNLTFFHRANFNSYLIVTGNIIELSDRWRSGLRS